MKNKVKKYRERSRSCYFCRYFDIFSDKELSDGWCKAKLKYIEFMKLPRLFCSCFEVLE